uniref:Uncharacterized protein n=1 Tax=Anguilla anguilla TaxID=7936 RepID=A0A0E9THJ5_ANGAN
MHTLAVDEIPLVPNLLGYTQQNPGISCVPTQAHLIQLKPLISCIRCARDGMH